MGIGDYTMQMQSFDFDGEPLQVLDLNGKPTWVAREVGRALGYEDDGYSLVKMINRNWRDEFEEGRDFSIAKGDDLSPLNNSEDLTSPRGHLVLFESGFYLACILSRKPAGRRLRRWLADEVLPSIRQTGAYGDPAAPAAQRPTSQLDPARAQLLNLLDVAAELDRLGAPREGAAVRRRAALTLAPELEAAPPRHPPTARPPAALHAVPAEIPLSFPLPPREATHEKTRFALALGEIAVPGDAFLSATDWYGVALLCGLSIPWVVSSPEGDLRPRTLPGCLLWLGRALYALIGQTIQRPDGRVARWEVRDPNGRPRRYRLVEVFPN